MKILSEVFGLLGIILNMVIYQQKKRTALLRWKLISNVAWALHYGTGGNFTGAGVAVIGVIRETSFLLTEKRSIDKRPLLAAFLVLACISARFTWAGWFSLLPTAASMLSVVSFWQQKPNRSRLLALPISLCMLSYNILVGSISGCVSEVLVLTSALTAIYRHDRKGTKP